MNRGLPHQPFDLPYRPSRRGAKTARRGHIVRGPIHATLDGHPLMNVSGKSTALPLSAATTGQAVPARPGAAGPSTSAAAPASPPGDLSPRKTQIDHAHQAFKLRTAYVELQARGAIEDAQDADPTVHAGIRAAARKEIRRLGKERDRTIYGIEHPPQKPASKAPAQRIVGFDVKPAP